MSSNIFKITKKEAVKDADCETEVHVDLLPNTVLAHRAEALKNLGANAKLDGFRDGHIPEKILVDRLGEIAVLEEAGQLALEKHYHDIILATELKAIGSPKVLVTKVAPGEAFGVKIQISTIPETKITDYKKVAKEVFVLNDKDQKDLAEKTKAEEKEVEEAIKNLQQQIAHHKYHEDHPDDHGHDHGNKDLELPEVNEEFIKKFGDFKTVEEFKAKISENIVSEKTRKEKEKLRLTFMDKMIEKSDIKMPRMMVESELNRMTSEMSEQVAQMGLKLEDYLKHVQKTQEDIRKDWEGDAVKRAKTQIILNHVAIEEKIEANKDEVEVEVTKLMNYYKDADKMRATILVEQFLTNDLVWKFVEGVK